MKRIEDTVTLMLKQIREDMCMDRVPHSVSTFSQLHDYVDANEYGGFCEDGGITDQLIERFGGRDEDYGMPEEVRNYIQAAQDMVDLVLSYDLLWVGVSE